MLRKLVMIFFFILILSACDSDELSLKKIEDIPTSLEEDIDANLRLQLIEGKRDYYVIFQSAVDIEADVEVQDDTVVILFDELKSEATTKQQNVYHLNLDKDYESIDVWLNNKHIEFDEVIIHVR